VTMKPHASGSVETVVCHHREADDIIHTPPRVIHHAVSGHDGGRINT